MVSQVGVLTRYWIESDGDRELLASGAVTDTESEADQEFFGIRENRSVEPGLESSLRPQEARSQGCAVGDQRRS